MKMGPGNIGPAKELVRDGGFAQFDRLPRAIRETMSQLPINYSCRGITTGVRKHRVDHMVRALKAGAARDYREWFREEFGVDYPGDET